MSRSNYSDEFDSNYLYLYRAIVKRALKGKRGQVFLMEMAAAMDAMPVKELIAGELVNEHGACCAIGTVCKSRGLDVSKVDCYDPDTVGRLVGVSRSMAAEIEYMNDEWNNRPETPAERWMRMRKWVDEQIVKA